MFGKKLYLSPILDLYSSDLVSYTISDRPVPSMVATMLDKLLRESQMTRTSFSIPTKAGNTNTSSVGRCSVRRASGRV